jgi:hypothetical protein
METARRIAMRVVPWLGERLLDLLCGTTLAFVVLDPRAAGFMAMAFMVLSGFVFSTLFAAIIFSETTPFERARTNATLFVAHFLAFPTAVALILGTSSPSLVQLGLLLFGGACAVFVSTLCLRTGIERLSEVRRRA